MADEEVGKLVIKLALDVRDMRKSAEEGKEQVTSLKSTIQNSWTELKSQSDLVGQYLGYIQQGLDATVGKSVEYAAQVRAFSREIGASAEDASKLIQAADDMGVSFDTLQAGMIAAVRKGIDPTIAGMEQLADQYVAIQDPVDRTKFLLDNFGKAGADLGPLMALGAAGIREAGKAAEDAGLVMDEKGVQAAREYEIALDNLGDTSDAIAMKIGNFLIPPLTSAANAFMTLVSWGDQARATLDEHNQQMIAVAGNYGAYVTEMKRAADAAGLYINVQGDLANVAGIVIQENYLLSESGFAAARAVGDQREGAERLGDAYKNQKQPVEDMTQSLNDQAEALKQILASTKDFTKEMLYQQVAQHLDADAALALGRAMGVIDEKTVYTQQKLEALTQQYDKNKDGVVDATEATREYLDKVAALGGVVDALHDKTVTVTVRQINQTQTDLYEGIETNRLTDRTKGYADGGSFQVPAGYEQDNYWARFRSGEVVNVATPDQAQRGDPGMSALLAEIQGLRAEMARQKGFDPNSLARAIRDGLLQANLR